MIDVVYSVLFGIYSHLMDVLLELFPRDGMIAFLTSILALFIPVAILVIERSKESDEHAFPWEEETTIVQVAHPRMLLAAIVGASLSCMFWNQVSAHLCTLPFVLIIYSLCMIVLCWILSELYRWLLAIVLRRRDKNEFRAKQIRKYFNTIKTNEDRIRIWSMTWNSVWLGCPEQHLLINLYIEALQRHEDADISYLCLCHSFIANLDKVDQRELAPMISYSLSSVTRTQDVICNYQNAGIFEAILKTINNDNIFFMDFAYNSIKECADETQSCRMTQYLARAFFSLLTREDYGSQNNILDTCRFPNNWRSWVLVDKVKDVDERTIKQARIWLLEYTKWFCGQYGKRCDSENPERFHVSGIIDRVTSELLFGCNVDRKMFRDMILVLNPIGGVPLCDESTSHAYIRIFLERSIHRDFLCFNEGEDNERRSEDTLHLLFLVITDSDEYPDCYLDAIDEYEKELKSKPGFNDTDYDYRILLDLKKELLLVKRYKKKLSNHMT
mgnify:CR=1 FL=1